MLKMMFEQYKHVALKMLVDYVTSNKDKITIVSTEDSDLLTVNVIINKNLMPAEDHEEVSNALENLEKITKK